MATPVIYVHDAAIDEYVATILLTTMPEVDLQGIVIVNGDCVAGPAMQAAWRIQCFLGKKQIPLGLSAGRAWNPFPWDYRSDCLKQAEVPALSGYEPNESWPWAWYPPAGTAPPPPDVALARVSGGTQGFPSGDDLLATLLTNAISAGRPATLLVTGPLTPVRTVLQAQPSLRSGVARLVWMGGAFDGFKSNFSPISPQIVSEYAEWNAWWDAEAADWVLRNTSFPIAMVPVNLTSTVPLSNAFMQALQAQSGTYRNSLLAYQSYAAVLPSEPSYCMWDTVTAALLTRPYLFKTPADVRILMIVDGYYGGVLVYDGSGRDVSAYLAMADVQGFYDYVLNQLQS